MGWNPLSPGQSPLPLPATPGEASRSVRGEAGGKGARKRLGAGSPFAVPHEVARLWLQRPPPPGRQAGSSGALSKVAHHESRRHGHSGSRGPPGGFGLRRPGLYGSPPSPSTPEVATAPRPEGTLKAEGHSGPSEQILGGSDDWRASWRPCPAIFEGRPRADPAGHPPEVGGRGSRAPRAFYLAILHRPPGRAGDREDGGGAARCGGTGCRCGAPEPAGAPRGPRAEPASGRRGLRAGGAG